MSVRLHISIVTCFHDFPCIANVLKVFVMCMHCMFSDNHVNSIMQEGMTFTVGMSFEVTSFTEVIFLCLIILYTVSQKKRQ